eukprot:snap_masked-scaffold_9-processed-gene-4.34-mRNA-1 protein AED:1.00 eAED:1.00 QI:0/-1/0/0/-1/1/1/0/196
MNKSLINFFGKGFIACVIFGNLSCAYVLFLYLYLPNNENTVPALAMFTEVAILGVFILANIRFRIKAQSYIQPFTNEADAAATLELEYQGIFGKLKKAKDMFSGNTLIKRMKLDKNFTSVSITTVKLLVLLTFWLYIYIVLTVAIVACAQIIPGALPFGIYVDDPRMDNCNYFLPLSGLRFFIALQKVSLVQGEKV